MSAPSPSNGGNKQGKFVITATELPPPKLADIRKLAERGDALATAVLNWHNEELAKARSQDRNALVQRITRHSGMRKALVEIDNYYDKEQS